MCSTIEFDGDFVCPLSTVLAVSYLPGLTCDMFSSRVFGKAFTAQADRERHTVLHVYFDELLLAQCHFSFARSLPSQAYIRFRTPLPKSFRSVSPALNCSCQILFCHLLVFDVHLDDQFRSELDVCDIMHSFSAPTRPGFLHCSSSALSIMAASATSRLFFAVANV